MKVVILAGGLGSRISEESHLRPKPMTEINGNPILWHIMKSYSYYGYNDFIICSGYKGYVIKEYFADYYLHHSDVTFDFRNNNQMELYNNVAEPWKVTIINTGEFNQTGSRIKQIEKYIDNETFMLTYGDGVSNVDINDLVRYHKEHGKIATMTAVQPGGRFGVLEITEDEEITKFSEKSKEDGGWINAGFMVLEPGIFNYLNEDSNLVFEQEPLKNLAKDGQLMAYKHKDFWHCMDNLRDKNDLERLLIEGRAPWVKWK
nr:glucose-1-phosphate cytidylyltransferase [uncultured Anaerosporobacter sp.]